MDEMSVMLFKLEAAVVLVSERDGRNCRGACVKRTMASAIECICAAGGIWSP